MPAVGFKTPPGAENNSPFHALNDHTYCCGLNADVCAAKGEPDAKYTDKCLGWHQKRFSQRTADAKRMGIPLIISEFGSCMDTDSCYTEIKQVADTADEYLTGWAYWQFKTYRDVTSSA